MSKKTHEIQSIQRLETGPDGNLLPFSTKKANYIPIKPGSPVGIARWTIFESLSVVLGFGMTFSQLLDRLHVIELELAADKPFAEIRRDSILMLNSIRRGIVDMSKSRYSQALYVATIFILQEGEDRWTWTIERADAIIEDWAKSGISEEDLFFFAFATVTGLKEQLKKVKAEIRLEEEKLSGFGSSMQTAPKS